MNLIILSDSFPPKKNSASIQIYDLCKEFVRKNHKVTVIFPSAEIEKNIESFFFEGIKVVNFKTKNFVKKNRVFRGISEISMFLFFIFNFKRIVRFHLDGDYDGIIWYSPTIFFGPIVRILKSKYKCPSYLILRDIFPQWMLDLKLLNKGLSYYILKFFELYQYKQADVIGVQSKGNLNYFNKINKNTSIEVLNNWLSDGKKFKKKLTKKFTYIHAGNLGVAQNPFIFLEMFRKLPEEVKSSIKIIFIGRGEVFENLSSNYLSLREENIEFLEEVSPKELELILENCNGGLVFLDRAHKTHNIPGKFILYIRSGLPVFAHINFNNDLASLIKKYDLGNFSSSEDLNEIQESFISFHEKVKENEFEEQNSINLFNKEFRVSSIVEKIIFSIEKSISK